MVFILAISHRKDTIKRVETKTRFKYPEREYLRVSDAKILQCFGEVRNSEKWRGSGVYSLWQKIWCVAVWSRCVPIGGRL